MTEINSETIESQIVSIFTNGRSRTPPTDNETEEFVTDEFVMQTVQLEAQIQELVLQAVQLDTQVQELSLPTVPRRVNGKLWIPPITSKRTNPETGIYNIKPKDPEYFNKYYNEKNRVPVECPQCACMIPKLTLPRHMRSNKCKKMAKKIIVNLELLSLSDLD